MLRGQTREGEKMRRAWRAAAGIRGSYAKFPPGNAAGTWRDTAGVGLWAGGGGKGRWDPSLQSWRQRGGWGQVWL